MKQKLKSLFIFLENLPRYLQIIYYLSKEKTSVTCPICKDSDGKVKVISRFERYKIPLKTVECGGCGLWFFNPMPTFTFLKVFYTNIYQSFHRNKNPDFITTEREKNRAKKAYFHIKEYLGSFKTELKIYDIGCSAGHVLHELSKLAKTSKPQLFGIEPDPNYVNYICKNLPEIKVECSLLENSKDTGKYDLILLMHGIEHMRDMDKVTNIIKDKMKDNGLLYIETPNSRNWKYSLKYRNFLLISKLYTFNPDNLKYYFKLHGLECVKLNSVDDKHICALFKKV